MKLGIGRAGRFVARYSIIDHKEAEGIMMRRLIVVDGPLAWRMRRFQAAQANEVGLEVLTLPLLASRLAGGFRRLADRETLTTCVARALQDGGFAQLDDVRGLPGMVRAALQTLERAWTADIDLDGRASSSPRIADMSLLQRRVCDALPHGAMLPQQLPNRTFAGSRSVTSTEAGSRAGSCHPSRTRHSTRAANCAPIREPKSWKRYDGRANCSAAATYRPATSQSPRPPLRPSTNTCWCWHRRPAFRSIFPTAYPR